jgi:hypothetical protein
MRGVQCHVEFGYQLSICSRTDENHWKKENIKSVLYFLSVATGAEGRRIRIGRYLSRTSTVFHTAPKRQTKAQNIFCSKFICVFLKPCFVL